MTITAIIPTYRREQQLLATLEKLLACDPPPSQIIVHVDAGDQESARSVAARFPEVGLIVSDTRQGPGGGRNKLIQASSNEYIASFDDDSWPMKTNFFATASKLLDSYQEYALLGCAIIEADEAIAPVSDSSEVEDSVVAEAAVVDGAGFVGCGCVFRRSAFLATAGYVPLALAYGMEEADVSLKLFDRGYKIGNCRQLTVFHQCDRETHHADAKINAAQITNTALLAYLRYPLYLWPYGLAQVANRTVYAMRRRRFRGILAGIVLIPAAIWKNRHQRQPVSAAAMRRWRRARQA